MINDETDYIKEQIVQMVDQTKVLGIVMLDSLTASPEIFAAMAKLTLVIVKEFENQGFTRAEAMSIASGYVQQVKFNKS